MKTAHKLASLSKSTVGVHELDRAEKIKHAQLTIRPMKAGLGIKQLVNVFTIQGLEQNQSNGH